MKKKIVAGKTTAHVNVLDMKDSGLTKGELVYRSLKTGILSGSLEPGKLLSANRLAKEFRTARSVVCESLARLKAEGLVRGEGAYARTYVEQQELPAVVEHYEVREAIESTAARLAAQNMNSWQVAELRRLQAMFDKAVHDGDEAAQAEANIAFHRYLVAHCGNALLLKIYDSYHLAPVVVRSIPINDPKEKSEETILHTLCEAIGSRDADLAEAIMRKDLREVTAKLRRLASAAPSEF